MAKQSIPVVDLQRFVSGDAADQAAFVKAVGESFVEYGFVAVDKHGVAPQALHAGYSAVKAFFALPTSVKMAYERPTIGRERGYTGIGTEHARDSAVADIKEFWHSGPELPAAHPSYSRIPKNVQPTEVPAFAEAVMNLWDELFGVAQVMMRALARYLGAEESLFIDMIAGSNTIQRFIHYPAETVAQANEGAVWAAAHEDINMMTLLPEATEPGLELWTRDERWLPIAPIPGQIIADTGDMMQRLTNGLLPATTHRVVAPAGAQGDRYSMPFFIHGHPDFVIEPLPGMVTQDRPRRWPTTTVETYLEQRLREIGLRS